MVSSLLTEGSPVIMYHGTDGNNLPGILRDGLVPFPSHRAWAADPDAGFNTPSRQSYGGVYLTRNVMTAISSSSNITKYKRKGLIVVCRVEPKSLFADEDDIVLAVNGAVGSNEYPIAEAYAAYVSSQKEGPHQSEAKTAFAGYQKDFADGFVRGMEVRLSNPNPKLMARVREIGMEGFVVSLKRKAAYLSSDSTLARVADDYGVYPLKRPDKANVESEFREFWEKATHTLKGLARAERRTSDFNVSGRSLQPIKFSGTNRILAIFEFWSDRTGGNYRTLINVVYGKVPDETVKEWEQREGKWTLATDVEKEAA